MDNSTLFDPEDDNQGSSMELQPIAATTSPFDALRQMDEHGEFWSARDVMPHLEYGQWRRFVDSIDRAMAACRNSGDDVEDHFAASGKITKNARGQQRVLDDFRLSRHGAFLVAMNGDPRKEAIASAQTYFARQARKQELAEQAAETAPPPGPSMDLANINDLEQISMALIQAVGIAKRERAQREIEAAGRQAAEEEIAVLEPKAAEADHHRAADGCMAIGDFANKLQAWARQNCGVRIYHEDVWDFLGDIGLIIRGNTIRKNQPTSFATERDYVRTKTTRYETKTRGDQVSTSSRLTPPGEGWAWDRAVTRLNDFGSLRKPMDGVA